MTDYTHNGYNYRVDIVFRGKVYKSYFIEYWLAKVFANNISEDDEVDNVFLCERIHGDFTITKTLK